MIGYRDCVRITPGLAFCSTVAALIAVATNRAPQFVLDPLLMALLVGIGFNNIFPRAQWHRNGTTFAGKFILEFSVMILGASIFLPKVASAGLGLFILVVLQISASETQ